VSRLCHFSHFSTRTALRHSDAAVFAPRSRALWRNFHNWADSQIENGSKVLTLIRAGHFSERFN
jgi:hypothetical protein